MMLSLILNFCSHVTLSPLFSDTHRNEPTLGFPPSTHSSPPPRCDSGSLRLHLRHQHESGRSQPHQDWHEVPLCKWPRILSSTWPATHLPLKCPICKYNFKHDFCPYDENTRMSLMEVLDQYDAEKKCQKAKQKCQKAQLKAARPTVVALDQWGDKAGLAAAKGPQFDAMQKCEKAKPKRLVRNTS
jgi:hypothetical protein